MQCEKQKHAITLGIIPTNKKSLVESDWTKHCFGLDVLYSISNTTTGTKGHTKSEQTQQYTRYFWGKSRTRGCFFARHVVWFLQGTWFVFCKAHGLVFMKII